MCTRRLGRFIGVAMTLTAMVALAAFVVGSPQLLGVDWTASFGTLLIP